jgi:hypothetical protein
MYGTHAAVNLAALINLFMIADRTVNGIPMLRHQNKI